VTGKAPTVFGEAGIGRAFRLLVEAGRSGSLTLRKRNTRRKPAFPRRRGLCRTSLLSVMGLRYTPCPAQGFPSKTGVWGRAPPPVYLPWLAQFPLSNTGPLPGVQVFGHLSVGIVNQDLSLPPLTLALESKQRDHFFPFRPGCFFSFPGSEDVAGGFPPDAPTRRTPSAPCTSSPP